MVSRGESGGHRRKGPSRTLVWSSWVLPSTTIPQLHVHTAPSVWPPEAAWSHTILKRKQIMSRKIRGKNPSNWICLYKPTHRCRSVVYCLCSQHFVVLKCQHQRREGAWGTMLEESSGTAWVSPPPCTARTPWALRPHWTSVPASSLGWGKPRGNPSTGFSIPGKNVDTTSKHEFVTCSYNSIL